MEPNNMHTNSANKVLNFFELFDTVTSFLNQPIQGELTTESIDNFKVEIEEFSKRVDQFVSGYLREIPEVENSRNTNWEGINQSYLAIGNVFLVKMEKLNYLLIHSLQKLQKSASNEDNFMDYLNHKNWVVYDLSSNLQRNIDLLKIAKTSLIFD